MSRPSGPSTAQPSSSAVSPPCSEASSAGRTAPARAAPFSVRERAASAQVQMRAGPLFSAKLMRARMICVMSPSSPPACVTSSAASPPRTMKSGVSSRSESERATSSSQRAVCAAAASPMSMQPVPEKKSSSLRERPCRRCIASVTEGASAEARSGSRPEASRPDETESTTPPSSPASRPTVSMTWSRSSSR